LATVAALLAKLAAEEAILAAGRAMFVQMGEYIAALEHRLAELDTELATPHMANPLSQILAAIPGVGLVTALTLAVTVEAQQFASARHFAAWLA
jgi:transposase